ncbi:MAG TPA: malto-oligosyltrehalose synthase [Verrucomicrobiae bacterium]|jgi:(1->4)-alpha-D-glucan 1-alpha-D-glucosylmutase
MRPGPDTVPRATYRIQFNHECTLAQARALVPYLHELGVSHIYASPLLKAVPGSMHGYDICDFHQLNPEVGTPADFAALHDELARHKMGLVLDVVPNHMGIDGQNNQWWWDVLKSGAASRYAGCFDIDWLAADPRLRGKVAMPVLGERYHEAITKGNLRLAEKDGVVTLLTGGQTLPVSPESMAALRKQGPLEKAIAEINGSPKALDDFVQKQHYLLMFWRNAPSMLNYRRFFTISSLAGIRIEEEWVLNEAFSLVKEWLAKGWVNGLRVDHADGLRHPEQFLRRLREMAPAAWIVLEKILEPGEPLNPHWPVDGTTGYDFLHVLNGVFIDPEGEKPLSDFYAEFTGETLDYPALVRVKKQLVIREQLAAESTRLTDLLVQIAARHWECRDCTRAELDAAWTELAVCLPVYRTYTGASDDPEVSKRDARLIRAVAAAAREQRPGLPPALFDFLEDLLLLRRRGELEDDFALRFQQLTGPVMAKAVEDTAFYCYARFAALNEVGGDPHRFGLSLAGFHQWCERQQRLWPNSMAASSTHDTKWGGDARARLALLSERPREWAEAVRRWSRMLEPRRTGQWPDRRSEYLFYQALAGAWPLSKERALAYMEKAAREGKEHTCWEQPAQDFEAALQRFVSEAMEDGRFMADVERFITPLLDLGWVNSLAQTIVKLTATGVPDIYQGAELWDLNLTDPDNRRTIDFAPRRQILAEARGLSAEEAWRRRESGLPKAWLIWKSLAAREHYPSLFSEGAYEPLPVSGAGASHVLAFMRGGGAITVAPRLIGAGLEDWGDTKVELPAGRWKNVLTDTAAVSGMMKVLTARFPVALLAREEES